MLEQGRGLPNPQPEIAERYWRLAAYGGDPDAEVEYANRLRKGAVVRGGEAVDGQRRLLLTDDEIARLERFYGAADPVTKQVKIRRVSVPLVCDRGAARLVRAFWVWDWGRSESPEAQFRRLERETGCSDNALLRATLTYVFETASRNHVPLPICSRNGSRPQPCLHSQRLLPHLHRGSKDVRLNRSEKAAVHRSGSVGLLSLAPGPDNQPCLGIIVMVRSETLRRHHLRLHSRFDPIGLKQRAMPVHAAACRSPRWECCSR